MNVTVYLALLLLLGQPAPRPASPPLRNAGNRNAAPAPIRPPRTGTTYRHWCDQPTRRLRWLNRMIQNAQSWPPDHYGWEVHQARYQGREVFVLHLCRYCGLSRGFLLYNHYGELIGQGEGADSVRLSGLNQDRLLARNPGRMGKH